MSAESKHQNDYINLNTILATKKSKLAQMVGPLIGGNNKTFLVGVIKDSSSYTDISKHLELLQEAQKICIPCTKLVRLSKKELKRIEFAAFIE